MTASDLPKILTLFFYTLQATTFFMTSYFILDHKYSFWRSLGLVYGLSLLNILMILPFWGNPLWKLVLSYCFTAGITCLLYRSSLTTSLFVAGLFYLLGAFVELLIAAFFSFFTQDKIPLEDPYFIMSCNLIYTFIYLVLCSLVVLIWKNSQKQILPRSMRMAFLIPSSQFILLLGSYFFMITPVLTTDLRAPACMLIILGTVLSFFSIAQLFRMLRTNSDKLRLEAQMEMFRQLGEQELRYYDSVHEKILETRKIRHDFQNQLQTAYSLFRSGGESSRQQALEQLDLLEQRIAEAAPVYFCPNTIANTILAEKSGQCEKAGISFRTDVRLPVSLEIDVVDLCSIFSNLLDNAVKAAAVTEHPYVDVSAGIHAGYCVIKVENSFCPDQKTPPVSSSHGYGMLILESIASQYEGAFTLEKNGNVCTAVIRCRLMPKGEKNENFDL